MNNSTKLSLSVPRNLRLDEVLLPGECSRFFNPEPGKILDLSKLKNHMQSPLFAEMASYLEKWNQEVESCTTKSHSLLEQARCEQILARLRALSTGLVATYEIRLGRLYNWFKGPTTKNTRAKYSSLDSSAANDTDRLVRSTFKSTLSQEINNYKRRNFEIVQTSSAKPFKEVELPKGQIFIRKIKRQNSEVLERREHLELRRMMIISSIQKNRVKEQGVKKFVKVDLNLKDKTFNPVRPQLQLNHIRPSTGSHYRTPDFSDVSLNPSRMSHFNSRKNDICDKDSAFTSFHEQNKASVFLTGTQCFLQSNPYDIKKAKTKKIK